MHAVVDPLKLQAIDTVAVEDVCPTTRTTTLYDLMAELQDSTRPDADDFIVATVTYLLRSGQVTCVGDVVSALNN